MRLRHLLLPLLLLATPQLTRPAAGQVVVGVSVTAPPPALPVYEQPPIPGPGYIWTPGYWAWNGDGYVWVPGAWVLPPAIGLLWTPGYWAWSDDAYLWHAGYWGEHVGFYGGINYGFGYFGHGYDGGYWRHGEFFYNRSVNIIRNVTIVNVYNRPVPHDRMFRRMSYNGGPGGVAARPSRYEVAAMHERHTPPTAFQLHHAGAARGNTGAVAPRRQPGPTMAGGSGLDRSGRSVGGLTAVRHGAAPGPAIAGPRAPGALPALREPNGRHAAIAQSGSPRLAAASAGRQGSPPGAHPPASRPGQAYRAQPPYAPRQAYHARQSWGAQPYQYPGQAHRSQPAYHPQQAYRRQPAYRPLQGYRPQPAYHPQQAYRPHPAYYQQHAYRPQPAYRPQQTYRPQLGFRGGQSHRSPAAARPPWRPRR